MINFRRLLILVVLAHGGPKAASQAAALSAPSGRVAVTDDRGVVSVFDLQTGRRQWTQNLLRLTVGPKTTPLAEVSSLAFSPSGKTLAVGGGVLYHGHVALLDADTGKLLWAAKDLGSHQEVCVAFSPDGKTIVGGSRFGPAVLLDAGTGRVKRKLEAKGVVSLAFSPDGKFVAGTCEDARDSDHVLHEVKIWDAETGKVVRTIPGGRGVVAFSSD